MNFSKKISISAAVMTLSLCYSVRSSAQRPVRFHNETTDTTTITNILIDLDKEIYSSPQELVSMAGKKLLGIPYVANTLEGDSEILTVNLDEVDCTTFMEMAAALAKTIESRRTSWRDFVYNLEQLRYRGGRVDGYPSRLHYISDWIVDNSHRDNVKEVTALIGPTDYAVKTIDFMSTNRDKYPSLKDEAAFTGIKNAEIGYRSHRYPYIKPMNVKKAKIEEGDIIAITTSIKGLDVSHVGIATIVDGKVHLMHASSKAKKVIVDPLPLDEYLRRNRSATGIRVIRLKE